MVPEIGDDVALAWEGRARRAYERGRMVLAMRNALVLTAVLASLARLSVGRIVWYWLLVPFVLWNLVEYRGRALLRGGRLGLLAGAVTLVAPLTVLRPCCRPGMAMSADCCAMPGTCALVGVVIGLSLAVFIPLRRGTNAMETAVGMSLGIVAAGVLKCPTLLVTEMLGLFGGLLAAVAVVGVIDTVVARWRAAGP